MLNLQGTILQAVDPRPRLGLPTPSFHPDQHLMVVCGDNSYLLWVDRVEQIISVQPHAFVAVSGGTERTMAPFVVRVDDEVLPVLSPEVLAPAPLVQPATEPTE